MSLECRELGLYLQTTCQPIEDFNSLAQTAGDMTIVLRESNVAQLTQRFPQAKTLATLDVVVHKTGTFNKLIAMAQGNWPLEKVAVVQIRRN